MSVLQAEIALSLLSHGDMVKVIAKASRAVVQAHRPDVTVREHELLCWALPRLEAAARLIEEREEVSKLSPEQLRERCRAEADVEAEETT